MDASPNCAKSDPAAAAPTIILFGLGFTTSRLARRLLARGAQVCAVVRNPSRYRALEAIGLKLYEYSASSPELIPTGCPVVHTIPPLEGAEKQALREFLTSVCPKRVIYISSTSVYGEQLQVNSDTPALPAEDKGLKRVEEETWLILQAWSTLILRPAAIYGPGRGIHVRVREGRSLRNAGGGVVSRIHADDLSAILEASLYCDLEGAWPCADGEPCSSQTLLLWCQKLLNFELDSTIPALPVSGRNVDGTEILRRLGLTLRYPDWRSGTLASLQEEFASA